MRPPPTRFARPLKGALPVARQSRFHGSRWETSAGAGADITKKSRSALA
jgi:hypothetical protein